MYDILNIVYYMIYIMPQILSEEATKRRTVEVRMTESQVLRWMDTLVELILQSPSLLRLQQQILVGSRTSFV